MKGLMPYLPSKSLTTKKKNKRTLWTALRLIRIFVGSAPKWYSHEPVLEYSIRKNTEADVEVTFMRPGENGLSESGCTGFTNFRFAVPEIAGHEGFAIYLDIDMLVLGDIAELWEYRDSGKWVCMRGATEVSVIDCRLRFPPKEEIHHYEKWILGAMIPKSCVIPKEWNVEDDYYEGAKLIHFTDLRQDWINGDHSCREALEVLHEYRQGV